MTGKYSSFFKKTFTFQKKKYKRKNIFKSIDISQMGSHSPFNAKYKK